MLSAWIVVKRHIYFHPTPHTLQQQGKVVVNVAASATAMDSVHFAHAESQQLYFSAWYGTSVITGLITIVTGQP